MEFMYFLKYFVIPEYKDLTIKEIIDDVKAFCVLRGNKDIIKPKVRIAGKLKNGLLEYALYDDQQNFVEITADGWRLIDESHNKFLLTSQNHRQKYPQKTSKELLPLLSKYLNTDKDSQVLLVCWLVQAFCEGNHSALLITAEKGSGKSMLTKIIQKIIDPSKTAATVFPSKIDDLLTALSNNYVVSFDNVGKLSDEASNILCTSITGGTYAKREFFNTNLLSTFTLHNTVILNGIDMLPSKSDLAERCLLLKLSTVNPEQRKKESEVLENFYNDLPLILGGIFNTLSDAMKIIQGLTPKKLPRMADSYVEMLAIAVALGVKEEDFERIYNENIERLNKERADTDLVYVVKEYMDKCVTGRTVQGRVSEVYNKIYNATPNKNLLPKSASHFGRKLRAEYGSFSAVGLTINFDTTRPDGTHIQIIKN